MHSPLQELVSDVHCIIDAMIGRNSDVSLMRPQLVNTPPFVLGDPDRLRGILLNLYTNAAKFTRQGAIALRVSVHSTAYRPRPADHSNFYRPERAAVEQVSMLPEITMSSPLGKVAMPNFDNFVVAVFSSAKASLTVWDAGGWDNWEPNPDAAAQIGVILPVKLHLGTILLHRCKFTAAQPRRKT